MPDGSVWNRTALHDAGRKRRINRVLRLHNHDRVRGVIQMGGRMGVAKGEGAGHDRVVGWQVPAAREVRK